MKEAIKVHNETVAIEYKDGIPVLSRPSNKGPNGRVAPPSDRSVRLPNGVKKSR